MAAESHEQISRTASDTLEAEFADYVSTGSRPDPTDHTAHGGAAAAVTATAGYTQRVEFALKLGYTERLVQAALERLGAQPTQNELLAELIKLGAQPQAGSPDDDVFADSSNNCGPPASARSSTFTAAAAAAEFAAHCGDGTGGLAPPAAGDPELPVLAQRDAHAAANSNGLRPIVIDGSNVAMGHGNKDAFSCRGIQLAVDWFRARGHRDITVFVPKWRKESPRLDHLIRDQALLTELEQERVLVFTPSRFVNGKRQVCYDDRYILKVGGATIGWQWGGGFYIDEFVF